jgi:autotransporter translocation and assembly factor TamB
MLKRILRIASVIVAAVAVLIILALVFFSSSPGESIIKNFLVNMVNKQLGLTVAIERFETNLFSQVQLNEITVISSAISGYDSLLYVDKVNVTYSIFALLFGDMRFESVIIDKMNLNISVDSLGNYGIPMLDTIDSAVSKDEETSVSISVGSVALIDINVSYTDNRIPVDINLYNLSSQINGHNNNEYDGRLTADSIVTRYEGEQFCSKKMNCDFLWDGEKLSITSVSGIEGLELTIIASLQLPDLNDISLNASLEGDPTGLLKILKNRYELPHFEMDNIVLKADARGSIESPEIVICVSSHQSLIENISLNSFQLYAKYFSDTVHIDTAIVKFLGGYILAQGYISLAGAAAVNAGLRIEGIELSELWPVVYERESPFMGNMNGSIRAKGITNTLSGWDINGNLYISNLQYRGQPTEDLVMKFSVLNDSAQLTLVHTKDTIETVVVLKNRNVNGTFFANIPEISSISRFANIPNLKGNVIAEGTFSGSMDNPLVNARLKGNKISYQNFPIDNITADIQYRDKNIIINALNLSGRRPDSTIYQNILGVDSIYGQFEYTCNIRGSIDSLESEISAKIVSLKYSGYAIDSAFALVSISGSSIELNNLNIYFRDLIFETSGLYDTVSAYGTLKTDIFSSTLYKGDINDENSIDDNVKINRGTITTDFNLSGDKDMRFNIDCDTVWLGLLKYLTEIDTPENGFLNLNLSFKGNLNYPVGSLSATAYSIMYPSYEIDSVFVMADLDGEYLRISNLLLFAYSNSLSANTDIYLCRSSDNNLTFSEESAISGELTMDNLDLSILKPYVTPTGEITGTSSANISWDGTIKNPGLNGWLKVTNGHLKYTDDSTSLDQIHLRLNLSDSIFSIDSASCYSAGTPLSVKGAITYDFSGNYEISANLSVHNIVLLSAEGKIQKDDLELRIFSDDFDLDILRPFMTMADSLGGNLKSEIFIGGKTNMPDITGNIKITDFSLLSSALSLIIKSGILDVKFDKTRVDIDSLFAEVNGGSMVIKGYLIHDAGTLTDINIDLKASNISYEKASIFKAKLQFANLNYSRKDDQYFLDGDISFGESRLRAKFPLKSILPWARSVETVEYELPDIITRTRLNIRLRENNDLWIDNNLANIRMKAELGIIGTPTKPNLSGFVSVEEGYLIYLDRRFKVEKGNIYFSNPLKLNPNITLHAKTQVTEYQRTIAEKYTVYIKVEGNLENLRADIFSEPPLNKPDIVALLTLGTTRSRLTSGGENQGNIRNVLVERASKLTSDRVSGYISDKVGSIFGFDEFTVEGNLFKFDDSWGPHLVASRRISRRVELTYSTTVGHLNDQGVRLGYKLTPRISIQGETNQVGKSGIDLRYGLRFK